MTYGLDSTDAYTAGEDGAVRRWPLAADPGMGFDSVWTGETGEQRVLGVGRRLAAFRRGHGVRLRELRSPEAAAFRDLPFDLEHSDQVAVSPGGRRLASPARHWIDRFSKGWPLRV